MKYIYYSFIILITSACNKDASCIKDSGKISREQRTVEAFTSIQVYDNIELILKNDSLQSVEVEAGANLIPYIVTSISDGNLIIKNNNRCNWLRTYSKQTKVFVSQQNLHAIFQFGTGTIQSENTLHLTELIVHQYGAGDINLDLVAGITTIDLNGIGNITLQGKSEVLDAQVYNPGNFKFGVFSSTALTSKLVTILSQTEATCYVRADSILNGTIKSSGNIYYTGSAATHFIKEGTGNFVSN